MIPEERCEACKGKGTNWGVPCPLCDGSGLEPNFVQDSFEQHGEPTEKPKFKVDFGKVANEEPKIYMDMTGAGFIDKDGNKIPFGSDLHINPSDVTKHNESIDLAGYKGEVTFTTQFKKDTADTIHAFADALREFMKKEETYRTPMRYLMTWDIDKLLDLYNDYKDLFDNFGDSEYLVYLKEIKKVLKAKTKK